MCTYAHAHVPAPPTKSSPLYPLPLTLGCFRTMATSGEDQAELEGGVDFATGPGGNCESPDLRKEPMAPPTQRRNRWSQGSSDRSDTSLMLVYLRIMEEMGEPLEDITHLMTGCWGNSPLQLNKCHIFL